MQPGYVAALLEALHAAIDAGDSGRFYELSSELASFAQLLARYEDGIEDAELSRRTTDGTDRAVAAWWQACRAH